MDWVAAAEAAAARKLVATKVNPPSATAATSIPREVHMFWESPHIPPSMEWSHSQLENLNRDVPLRLWNADSAERFLREKIDDSELADAFCTLVPAELKSDLFRYCVLYYRGGIWLDAKFFLHRAFPLHRFLMHGRAEAGCGGAEAVFVEDTTSSFSGSIFLGAMATAPGHPLMRDAMDAVLKNVRAKKYGNHPADITGSHMFRGLVVARYSGSEWAPRLALKHMDNHVIVDCSAPRRPMAAMMPYYGYDGERDGWRAKKPAVDLWRSREIYGENPRGHRLLQSLEVAGAGEIPFLVFQTWKTNRTADMPAEMVYCMEDLRTHNPGFQFHLFSDEDCRAFLVANFATEVVAAYDTLLPGAYKADLWRYAVIYQHGGIYLDFKYHCAHNYDLRHFLAHQVTRAAAASAATEDRRIPGVWVRDRWDAGIFQATFAAPPRHPLLMACIQRIVEHTRTHFYGISSLDPTGPRMLAAVAKEMYGGDCVDRLELFHRGGNGLIISPRLNEDAILHNYGYRYQRHRGPEFYGTMWEERRAYLGDQPHVNNKKKKMR